MSHEIRSGDALPSSAAASTASPVSAPSAVPPVLAALRDATGAQHERLHHLMPLSVESAGLDDYLSHLRVLRAWLAPLEPWLAACGDGPAAHADVLTPVNRIALIDADLAAAPGEAPETPDDARPWWPADAGAAYRWGASYVLEGSQMGGAVLYNQLRDRLAPHPLGFLDAGRTQLSARWKAFVRLLAAHVESDDAIDAACRGAADAFARLVVIAEAERANGRLAEGVSDDVTG